MAVKTINEKQSFVQSRLLNKPIVKNFDDFSDFHDHRTFHDHRSSSSDTSKLIIVQPTTFCNKDCDYCYLPGREVRRIMANETVTKISQVLFASPSLKDGFTISWHAGEPLTLPVSFYEKAFETIDKNNKDGIKVSQNFQTNATLISQEWCNLIKEHMVDIGVSLDGPENIHDAHRKNRNGRGFFKEVMNGIELLKSNNINFGVIAVLTPESLEHPKEIFNFFIQNGIKEVGFNIEEIDGVHKTSSLMSKVMEEKYKRFISIIRELEEGHQSEISIRELKNIPVLINKIHGVGKRTTMSRENRPLYIVSFDFEGNVSTFSPELLGMFHKEYGRLTFGNVKEMTRIEDVLSNPKFLKVEKEVKAGVTKCKETCSDFDICGGGSPSNKLAENHTFDSTETLTCRFRIKLIRESVEEDIMLLQRR